jgi:hypothetical protein
MKRIAIVGWNPGFQKIEFSMMLKREMGFSLSNAKAATDSILAGKRLELSVREKDYEGLVALVGTLGAKIAI